MKILLSGITSFIGAALSKELLLSGHEVYGLVRADSKNMDRLSAHDNLYLIQRDMKSVEDMNPKALPKFDVCIHLAWDGIGIAGRMNEEIQKDNIEVTIKFIKKCKELGVKRFIFAGSQAEYGQSLEKHIGKKCDELVAEEPVSMYGKAKLQIAKRAARLCEELGMEYIHLRIFSVYGSSDHETSLVSSCIRYFRSKKKEALRLGECEQKWNYMYISDCVKAVKELVQVRELSERTEKFYKDKVFLAEELYRKNVINVASEDTRILKEFALEIADIYGQRENIEFVRKTPGAEGTPYLDPDISKLEALCGFKPDISFKEGVELIEKLYSL
jgi:putative NAD-dependent epimerase/dehydratase